MGAPSTWVGEGETQLPSQNLKIYYTELPLFIEVCVFRMRFNLNKSFTIDA